MLAPGFWDDQRAARKAAREAEGLREELSLWRGLTTAARDLNELFELATSEDDQALLDEVQQRARDLERDFGNARTSLLFSGEYADADALVATGFLALADFVPGDKVRLTVLRDGRRVTVEVGLAAG